MSLLIQKLSPYAKLPARATEGSAGFDLCCCISAELTLLPGDIAVLPTGIAVALEPGQTALVFGRSGLGIKKGIMPANGVGVIDSDYRGEIMVGLINHGKEPYRFAPGERIAQMLVVNVKVPDVRVVEALPETRRGAGGFGSTGRE
jgi:dUTP pyrophosphatase